MLAVAALKLLFLCFAVLSSRQCMMCLSCKYDMLLCSCVAQQPHPCCNYSITQSAYSLHFLKSNQTCDQLELDSHAYQLIFEMLHKLIHLYYCLFAGMQDIGTKRTSISGYTILLAVTATLSAAACGSHCVCSCEKHAIQPVRREESAIRLHLLGESLMVVQGVCDLAPRSNLLHQKLDDA